MSSCFKNLTVSTFHVPIALTRSMHNYIEFMCQTLPGKGDKIGWNYNLSYMYTCNLIPDEPQGTIIFNQFLLPLPRVSTRDVVAMKLWIPEYLTDDGSSGKSKRICTARTCTRYFRASFVPRPLSAFIQLKGRWSLVTKLV